MTLRAAWRIVCLFVFCAPVLAGEAEWQQHMKAGAAAYQRGDYQGAARAFEEGVQEARTFGEFDPRLATSLSNLGALYYAQGRHAEAEPLLKRALPIYEKALGPDHPNVATTLGNLAGIYAGQGRYAEAEPLARRALAMREKAAGPDHPDVAATLITLAKIHGGQGRYPEAESQYRRAVAIGEKTLGPAHPGVATWLTNLADFYQGQNRYDEAEPLYRRALGAWEKAVGPEHPHFATALTWLAGLNRAQGRHGEAEPLYARALAIREKAFGPGHPDVAAALSGLAGVYRAQGRYAQAEPLERRALAIREKALGTQHADFAISLSSMGALHESQGRYGDAEALHRRAVAIMENARGPAHVDVATALNNLATLYRSQGRYPEAEALFRRAFVIYQKALGPAHPHGATALNNLATIYRAQGRYPEAEALLKTALGIWEKALGPEHPEVAAALTNLADVYQVQRRYDQAEPLHRRALAIREKALGTDHPDTAVALGNLATVRESQGQHRESEALTRRALPILEKTVGPDHPSFAVALGNLAHVQRAQKQPTDALATMRRSTAILARRVAEPGAETSEGGRLAEQRSRSSQFEFHVSLLAETAAADANATAAHASQAFVLAQLARASDTADQVARMAARHAAGSDAVAAIARSRQDLAGRLVRLEAEINREAGRPGGRAAKLREEETGMRRELEALDARLEREFPSYRELTNPRPLELAEAQKLLGEDEALIVFLVSRSETFVWALRRGNSVLRRLPLSAADLEKRVRTLRLQLDVFTPADIHRLREPFDVPGAHALYRDLIAPVEGSLAGVRHLFAVPDRAVASLPLSVLVSEAPKAAPGSIGEHANVAWLAKKYAITTLPAVTSLRSLRAMAQSAPGSEPFGGFGDPLFAGRRGEPGAALTSLWHGTLADVREVNKLSRLPETADELRAIARTLKATDASLYLGARATETEVKRASLANKRHIAFATHGLMAGDFRWLMEPALALTPPAEASDLDDGLLTASEISQLKLNADWVILSACNTAASDGTPGAEGLSGLAKAFFYAGARSLLVSHWAVNSLAAVDLTTRMFEETAKGAAKSEALRRSMLALMQTKDKPHYAHPAFWAPFVVVGEGGSK